MRTVPSDLLDASREPLPDARPVIARACPSKPVVCGRFQRERTRTGGFVGRFVYGRS